VAAANPPGTGKIYFGGAIPTGYLACDGSAVSRVDYAALFAAIGTTWGAGDGSTTFNVPDFRGRFPLGEGQGNAPDATAWSFGQTAGTEQHTLTIGQMPVHDHQYEKYGSLTGVGGANPIWANTGTGVTAGAGGGQPHNNMPPLLVVKFIIKT
jgi:microcystin-dependent protein